MAAEADSAMSVLANASMSAEATQEIPPAIHQTEPLESEVEPNTERANHAPISGSISEEQLLTEGQETIASAAIPAFVSTNAGPEASPNVSISEAGSSLNQPLLLEERLKRLLESEDVQESVSAAKSFLNQLGCAKLEDLGAVTKAREQATILEAHVTGDELETLKLLLAKLDSLPLLQQTTD